MAVALKLLFGIPLSVGYIICSIVVIPLVTHGITFISRFRLWTQPFWIILQITPFVYVLVNDPSLVADWQNCPGAENDSGQAVNVIYIGAACAVLFSLVAQIG
ncbi:MAG: Mn2+/Fe2+ NRAMP family transporter [Cellvibrionaceae bacterium]|jgi:Mn2+/Fe2+ NRAMP family transporter